MRRSSFSYVWLKWVLLAAGVAGVGIYVYSIIDAKMAQRADEKAMEAARREARKQERLPGLPAAGSGIRGRDELPVLPRPEWKRLKRSELIGKVLGPRLGVEASVRSGVDSNTLRRAVGHIPGTALPGQPGNVGLAGHRDTFFRNLRDVKKSDRIVLDTLQGRFEYEVDSTRVVRPQDTYVLKPANSDSLTLVTCYPFNYVGSAPKRFIVSARLVPSPPLTVVGHSGGGR